MDLSSYLAVLGDRLELSDASAVELRGGQFHDVVLTATTVYRFPRDEASREQLPRRAAVLAALAEQDFGFAVPRPLAPVNAGEPVGRCFLATTRVPGAPLSRADAERWPDAVGRNLGRVLAALADATARIGSLVGATPDHWTRFAHGVEHELFDSMSPAGRRRARLELDRVLEFPAPATPGLVHFDLGGDNLLWEPGAPPRLASVIDWDELRLDSPANDIASIAATYGWSIAADAARRIDNGDSMMDQARHIAATFALQQALPAARSGDTENLEDGLLSYR